MVLVPMTSTRGKPGNRGVVIRAAAASSAGLLTIGPVVTFVIGLGDAVARGLSTIRGSALISVASPAGNSRAPPDGACSPRTGEEASGSSVRWNSAGSAGRDRAG